MSQENIEIVREGIENWNAGDMDALREGFHPDVIVRLPEGWPEPGPFIGREAVMRQWERNREVWESDTLEPIGDLIDVADRVVARFRWKGAGRGPESNLEFTAVYTVRNGLIHYQESFWDYAEALEAIGLSHGGARSRDNLELVRKARDAFNRRDLLALEQMSHPDLEFVSALAAVDAGESTYRGPKTWASYFARMDETWDDWQVEDFRTVDAGDDRVVAIFRVAGTGKSSGAHVGHTVGVAYWIREGKFWRMHSYLNPGDALEAVGLTKEQAPLESA